MTCAISRNRSGRVDADSVEHTLDRRLQLGDASSVASHQCHTNLRMTHGVEPELDAQHHPDLDVVVADVLRRVELREEVSRAVGALVDGTHLVGATVLALFQHGEEERGLVGEVGVHRAPGEAGCGRDLLHRRTAEPPRREHLGGGIEDERASSRPGLLTAHAGGRDHSLLDPAQDTCLSSDTTLYPEDADERHEGLGSRPGARPRSSSRGSAGRVRAQPLGARTPVEVLRQGATAQTRPADARTG